MLAGSLLAFGAAATAGENDPASGTSSSTPGAASATIAEVARGQRVRLAGSVVRVIDRDEFRLSDGTGSVPVRLSWDGPTLVEAGDKVTVEGIVDDDMTFGLARPEVYAESIEFSGGARMTFASAVDTATEARTEDVDAVEEPTAITTLQRGQTATIRGRVARILDSDEFRLEDESGSVRVYLGWKNRLRLNAGDLVTVAGVLDDDPWPIRPEFYASAITFADGRTVETAGETSGQAEPGPATGGEAAPAPRVRTSRIDDLRPYEVVRIEGVVERITDEDEFRIRDDSGSVRVYIGWRNQMPVARGERVSVVGIVDSGGPGALFREVYAYKLTTAAGRTVELQADRLSETQPQPQASGGGALPAAASVVAVESVRRGQTVALRGQVTRIRDSDEFVLQDDSGSIRIYIGWRNRMPVAVGDRVTVFGAADDDVFPGRRPEIYATRIVLPDGREAIMKRGGYDD